MYISPAPIACAGPAPVVEYEPAAHTATAPVVEYTSPAIAGSYVAPALEVYAAPPPVVEDISPAFSNLCSSDACRVYYSPAPICLRSRRSFLTDGIPAFQRCAGRGCCRVIVRMWCFTRAFFLKPCSCAPSSWRRRPTLYNWRGQRSPCFVFHFSPMMVPHHGNYMALGLMCQGVVVPKGIIAAKLTIQFHAAGDLAKCL